MTFALVPAGGKSTRMGRPKLSLPLGDRAVIEHVVHALRQADVHPILVVVGPHAIEIAPLAEKAGAQVCLLPQETPDMRATIELGLSRLEEQLHPGPEDDWLLVPADHPLIDATGVAALKATRAAQPHVSIFVPTWQGRRGHPTLLTWKHVASLRTLAAGLGLNSYLRLHTDETCEVAVNSPDILLDLDTPDDYEALSRRWSY